MTLSNNQVNQLRDRVLVELRRASLRPSERARANGEPFIIGTEGVSRSTGASYAGAIFISMDEKLTRDFYENLRAWLISKGLSVTDLI